MNELALKPAKAHSFESILLESSSVPEFRCETRKQLHLPTFFFRAAGVKKFQTFTYCFEIYNFIVKYSIQQISGDYNKNYGGEFPLFLTSL